ncbi:MAG: hypothetical protein J5537_12305 [Lachnospiraceae bacterium]|nr:hypothetical protein [Lachnospiraceae bacterium]
MNSNEEYLDNLLKSMQDKENEAASVDPTADDVAAIFDGLTDEPAPVTSEANPPTGEEVSAMSDTEIADILASMDNPTPEDQIDFSDEALMADAMKDSAIAEINELLYKNDNDEYVEPDPEEPAPSKKGGKKEKEPKEKKGLFGRFGRKKEAEPVVEEEAPLTIEEPVIEEAPLTIEEPAIEEAPLTIEEPIIEEEPLVEEEMPLTIEEPIIEEEVPVVEEEIPLTIEEPIIEEEAPVVEEEIPLTIEEPIIEEAPVVEEEVPLSIEEPVIEETPVAEEEMPLTIEEPIIEETPLVEEAPVVEEVPATEEAPAVEEEAPAESSEDATLESMFGDFFIEPSSEQKEYVEEPVVDLDDGLAELLSIAGVSEDDFKGETDENAAPKQPAVEPAAEEPAIGEPTLEDLVMEEAAASNEGVTLDPNLFGGMDNLGLDFGGDSGDSSAAGESVNPEDLLFASIDEVEETATPLADSEGLDDLMVLLGGDGEETAVGESLDDIPEKGAKPPKKKGGFLKMMELLTESDDDDEEEGEKFSFKDLFKKKKKDEEPAGEENPTGADAEGATTDENKEVNRQLDAEEEDGKKKKKKKKKRKKGEPEGAEELEEREPHERQAGKEDEESEEGGDGGKKGKKKKKEKKKKEPKPVDNRPLPKLSKKKVRATFCFALTLLAAILICVFFLGDVVSKQKARSAFYKGDYEECYRNFYGKKLTEGDENMFKKAELLLYLNRNKERYYEYLAIDDEYHALDSLLDAVLNKSAFMQKASLYGFDAEATAAYNEILDILSTYGLSEEDAERINAIEQDAVYTLYVRSIVDGTDLIIPDYLQDGYFEERVNALMNGEDNTDNEQFEDSDN